MVYSVICFGNRVLISSNNVSKGLKAIIYVLPSSGRHSCSASSSNVVATVTSAVGIALERWLCSYQSARQTRVLGSILSQSSFTICRTPADFVLHLSSVRGCFSSSRREDGANSRFSIPRNVFVVFLVLVDCLPVSTTITMQGSRLPAVSFSCFCT